MHGEQEREKTWGRKSVLPHNTGKGKSLVTDRLWHDPLSPSGQGFLRAEQQLRWCAQAACAFLLSPFFPTGQVDLDLLRRQQLKLYVLKAGRALLSHQDQLRQILSQPAVQEAAAAHTGIFLRSSFGSVRKADTPTENRQGTRKGKYR